MLSYKIIPTILRARNYWMNRIPTQWAIWRDMSCFSTDSIWLNKELKKPRKTLWTKNWKNARSNLSCIRIILRVHSILTRDCTNKQTRFSIIYSRRLKLSSKSSISPPKWKKRCKNALLSLKSIIKWSRDLLKKISKMFLKATMNKLIGSGRLMMKRRNRRRNCRKK
jgi:hypothetical protein